MDLASKYQHSSPWPARDKQQVLFILDTRNSFEQELLREWIHQHTHSGSEEFQAPQVCLDLGEDRKGIDSGQLVMALALPGLPALSSQKLSIASFLSSEVSIFVYSFRVVIYLKGSSI